MIILNLGLLVGWANAGTMLGQRRKREPGIMPHRVANGLETVVLPEDFLNEWYLNDEAARSI